MDHIENPRLQGETFEECSARVIMAIKLFTNLGFGIFYFVLRNQFFTPSQEVNMLGLMPYFKDLSLSALYRT